jgi:hypothetical protein
MYKLKVTDKISVVVITESDLLIEAIVKYHGHIMKQAMIDKLMIIKGCYVMKKGDHGDQSQQYNG